MTDEVRVLYREALELLISDPLAAADRLEAVGRRFALWAGKIRERVATSNPYSTPGGMSDRVMIRVTGPDGKVKQEVDVAG